MMIKKMVLTMLVIGATSTVSHANEVVAADSTNFTQICMTALAGNRAAMHNNIQSSGYSRPFIVNNVQCNGENIVAFVQKHGENPDAMLRILDRREHSTSITDLAKNTLVNK